MNTDLQDFAQFMERRAEAAGAYAGGDAGPLGLLVARSSPATFFGPQGGYCQGADAVGARYAADAAIFEPGGESRFEILQMAASQDVAYWVGFQRATVHMRGTTEAIPFNLRVTEVFRREGAEWKLVHRHADRLTSPGEDAR